MLLEELQPDHLLTWELLDLKDIFGEPFAQALRIRFTALTNLPFTVSSYELLRLPLARRERLTRTRRFKPSLVKYVCHNPDLPEKFEHWVREGSSFDEGLIVWRLSDPLKLKTKLCLTINLASAIRWTFPSDPFLHSSEGMQHRLEWIPCCENFPFEEKDLNSVFFTRFSIPVRQRAALFSVLLLQSRPVSSDQQNDSKWTSRYLIYLSMCGFVECLDIIPVGFVTVPFLRIPSYRVSDPETQLINTKRSRALKRNQVTRFGPLNHLFVRNSDSHPNGIKRVVWEIDGDTGAWKLIPGAEGFPQNLENVTFSSLDIQTGQQIIVGHPNRKQRHSSSAFVFNPFLKRFVQRSPKSTLPADFQSPRSFNSRTLMCLDLDPFGDDLGTWFLRFQPPSHDLSLDPSSFGVYLSRLVRDDDSDGDIPSIPACFEMTSCFAVQTPLCNFKVERTMRDIWWEGSTRIQTCLTYDNCDHSLSTHSFFQLSIDLEE